MIHIKRDDSSFRIAYRALEQKMEALADADGDVFLPNPTPEGPVDYVLICMEPSLGRWARTSEEAKSKVKAGFRNFLSSIEDFILHYSSQAASARKAGIVGHEQEFKTFKDSVSLPTLLHDAESVLITAGAPVDTRDETLARLEKCQLSESRRRLIFNYKIVFDSIRCSTANSV